MAELASDELDAYLEAVARADAYVAVRTLSTAGDGAGMTELVRFRATDAASLGPFVRKRIDLASGLGTVYEELFAAERAGRRFLHLPRIIECYKTGAELVVISEYVPGETLDAYVRAGSASRAGLACARAVFPALCDAVIELHEALDQPIIHRDLKPRNVIVAPAGLFLIDFGIARRYRDGAGGDTVRFGTRAWAPPEQYGFGQTDVRSDVFALGKLLGFCLTGEELDAPIDAAALAGVAGTALAEVAARATAFDPAGRYESVRALKKAFLAAVGAGAEAGEGAAAATSASRPERDADPIADGDASAAQAARSHPASGLRSRLARPLPGWIGVIWNALLFLVAVLCVEQAYESVVAPTGTDALMPLWYRVLFNVGFILPLFGGALYLLAYKRPLKRRIPALAARRLRDDLKAYLVLIVLLFVVLVVANVIALG